MSQNRIFVLLSSVVFLLILIVYSNHFDNEFQFDDFHSITDNLQVLSLDNIPRFFKDPSTTSVLPTHQSYRPGLTTLNTIDYAIYQKWKKVFPSSGIQMQHPFHVSIFIMYIIQGVLMFLLFLKLFNISRAHSWNRFFALFGTAIYMLHTVNAETINYIIQRADSYSTVMVIASLVLFIYKPEWRRFGIYLIPFVAGMLIKEPAIMFVPILFIYVVLFELKPEISKVSDIIKKDNIRLYLRAFRTILPGILLAALFLYISLYALRPETWSGSSYHWWDYLKTQPWVILRYFICFFLPVNLSADSDWGLIPNIFDERTIVGLAFIGYTLFLIIKNLRFTHLYPALFGMLWFFLALLPASSVISLAEVTNDHRMFFPFVGMAMTFTWLAALWLMKNENSFVSDFKFQNIVMMFAIAIPLALGYGTWQRNKVWDNPESLWYDVSVKSPRNGRGLMNYGLALMRRSDHEGALEQYNKALVYSPYYPYLHINMALCKYLMGFDNEEIEDHYIKAITYGRTYYGGYHYYGNWLFRQGRYQEAEDHLKRAISIAPNAYFSRSILMQLYTHKQMWMELNALANESLTAFPGNQDAIYYLELSEQQGIIKNETYYINLGLNHYNSQQYQLAIDAWLQALELNPGSAVIHNNIGSAYNAMKDYAEAVPWLQKALEINPDFTLAANNLKEAQKNLK